MSFCQDLINVFYSLLGLNASPGDMQGDMYQNNASDIVALNWVTRMFVEKLLLILNF